jgi:hypothetical protein
LISPSSGTSSHSHRYSRTAHGSSAPKPISRHLAEPSPVEPSLVEPNLVEPNLVEPSLEEPNLEEPNPVEPRPVKPSPVHPNREQLGRAASRRPPASLPRNPTWPQRRYQGPERRQALSAHNLVEARRQARRRVSSQAHLRVLRRQALSAHSLLARRVSSRVLLLVLHRQTRAATALLFRRKWYATVP